MCVYACLRLYVCTCVWVYSSAGARCLSCHICKYFGVSCHKEGKGHEWFRHASADIAIVAVLTWYTRTHVRTSAYAQTHTHIHTHVYVCMYPRRACLSICMYGETNKLFRARVKNAYEKTSKIKEIALSWNQRQANCNVNWTKTYNWISSKLTPADASHSCESFCQQSLRGFWNERCQQNVCWTRTTLTGVSKKSPRSTNSKGYFKWNFVLQSWILVWTFWEIRYSKSGRVRKF